MSIYFIIPGQKNFPSPSIHMPSALYRKGFVTTLFPNNIIVHPARRACKGVHHNWHGVTPSSTATALCAIKEVLKVFQQTN
jgi:hypothetical protein